MLHQWILKVLGVILGSVLTVLTLVFPDATKVFLISHLGVPDSVIVSDLIYGTGIIVGIGVALIIISSILKRLGYRIVRQGKGSAEQTEAKKEPITQLDAKQPEIRIRKKIDSSEEFLKNAHEVQALGLTVAVLTTLHVDNVKKLINSDNARFTIIIPEKESKHIDDAEKAKMITTRSANDIRTQLQRLQTLRSELNDTRKQNLQIRFFDMPLLHSMLIVNPKNNDGYMTVSFYDYNTDASQRHEIFLTKKDNSELFQKFLNSYQFIYDNSKEWNFET